MRRIGIVAALPGELKPLVREWPRTDEVFIGEVGDTACYAACAGIGAEAATRAFASIRRAAVDGIDLIVSYGWAGALSCGVKPPDAHVVSEVVDAKTGERFRTDSKHVGPGAPLRLVTLDHVALHTEKRALAERYSAVLVDMEAATIGRLAQAHALGFVCIKGISDGYQDRLPDFSRFITPDGQMRTLAFALHALVHPAQWGPLQALGRNSRAAADELAHAFPDALSRSKLLF